MLGPDHELRMYKQVSLLQVSHNKKCYQLISEHPLKFYLIEQIDRKYQCTSFNGASRMTTYLNGPSLCPINKNG